MLKELTELGETYSENSEIVTGCYIPIENYLKVVNSLAKLGEKVELLAFTCADKLHILNGAAFTRPLYLVSDGPIYVSGGNWEEDKRSNGPEFTINNSTYVGWSGENASFDRFDELKAEQFEQQEGGLENLQKRFYIKTSEKGPDLRKRMKQMGLNNIKLSCESESPLRGKRTKK